MVTDEYTMTFCTYSPDNKIKESDFYHNKNHKI